MRYRMSVIYGHPVMAATRALRFSDHVTKRNGGSGLCLNPTVQKDNRGVLGASFRVEQFSEIVGYSNMADYTNHINMRIASGKTKLINKTSTFLFT